METHDDDNDGGARGGASSADEHAECPLGMDEEEEEAGFTAPRALRCDLARGMERTSAEALVVVPQTPEAANPADNAGKLVVLHALDRL